MRCAEYSVILTVLLLAAPSGRVWAEEPEPAPVADPYDYHTVVRGRAVEERRPADDPAGFTTVLRIKDPPAGTELMTLLERVPGLRIKDTGPGGRKGLSLRGTDAHQAVVFLDGVRLSSAAGAMDLSLLDPAHLEKAEVRRGGGSARFGADALGGVLSLSTPRLRTRARNKASLSYGSFNSLAARASRSAALIKKLRYLASASYHQSDGQFSYLHHLNGTEHLRQNNDSRMGEMLLKADYLISDSWQVGLINDLALGERGAPGILDNTCATSRQQDLRNLTALRVTAYDLWLADSRLDLSLSHRFGQFRFYDPCEFNQPSHTQGFAVGASARWGVPLPGVGRLDAGLELQEGLLRDLQGTLQDPLSSRFSADLFVSSKVQLLWRHLVLVPAVRLSLATGQQATVVPKMGAVVRPLLWTKNRWLAPLALASNVGRSYRYPTFHELYVDLDSLRGNENLQPEDAVEADIGLRWRHKVVDLEVVYFSRRIKNLILYAPVSLYLVEANNYAGVTTDGVEASINMRPGGGVTLRAAYTHLRTRWGDPPLRLPGHPKHRLAARLTWGFPFKAQGKSRWSVKLWAGATVESDMALDQHNNVLLDSRVLLSAGGEASYRWLSLSAEGRNLLDRRDLMDTQGFPLPPARLLVSLSAAL